MHRVKTLAFLTVAMLSTLPAWATELDDTSWRLVNIASMDDTTYAPDDPSKFMLKFIEDNTAAILADCNRGTGTWTSESPSQLQFGPIAATRALCPPESLSEIFLAQFQWVRSYVIKDGHLFLATMADGAIIEFEPLPVLAAMVLGEEIHTADAAEMQDAILSRLFKAYAVQRGIEADEAEINAYIENLQRGLAKEGLTADDDLTSEEVAEVQGIRVQMATALISHWKINQSLHETYGGRIIYQQFGPEPLDAYRTYLEERLQAGDFKIMDPAMSESFWQYFKNEDIHSFMNPGSEDEANAVNDLPRKKIE